MALPSLMRLPGRAAALGGCEAQTTCRVGSHFCGTFGSRSRTSPLGKGRDAGAVSPAHAGLGSAVLGTPWSRVVLMVGIRGAAGEGAGTGGPITQTAAQPGGNSQAESHVLL